MPSYSGLNDLDSKFHLQSFDKVFAVHPNQPS